MIPASDPSDTYLMVLAWNTSRQGRDVALELADRNRANARPSLPNPNKEQSNEPASRAG